MSQITPLEESLSRHTTPFLRVMLREMTQHGIPFQGVANENTDPQLLVQFASTALAAARVRRAIEAELAKRDSDEQSKSRGNNQSNDANESTSTDSVGTDT